MHGCGASSKPRDVSAYANSALARDVIALIEHLRLDSVDVVGFSAGALTARRLLTLRFGAIRSAVIAGLGDYVVEGATLDFPQNFPIPEHLPRPLTHRIWAEEGARVLEGGEIIPGHLASANVIAARILGSDPHVMAAVIRGAIAEPMQVASLNAIDVPVLVLNGRADVVNQNTSVLLREIRTASLAQCEGDHGSTPYELTFHAEVLNFLRDRWSRRS
jgi:pimeloyl-ACP methyl ester carboxylesterase